MEKAIFTAWLVTRVGGFVLVSYGLLRESFKDLAEKKGFGEDRYGEGPYSGGYTITQKALISFAMKIRLLPADQTLTLTDRKANAAMAISGVLLTACSIVLDLAAQVVVAG